MVTPIGAIDPLGLDALDNAANVAAGLGDTISLGLSNWARKKLEINDVIDECSWSYAVGKWAGWLHGLALGVAGSLNAGARTILYSGEGALDAAQVIKGSGKILADTPLGGLLNLVDQKIVKLPQSVWDAASAVFAANAKGEVIVVLRNPSATGTWLRIEKRALDFVNRVHSWGGGPNITKIVPK